MPSFVHDIQSTQLALYCVYFTIGVTWFSFLFLKPVLRLIIGGDANVNYTISYATTVFSVFYGLLMGLLTVAAYQNHERVEQSAFREASSIAALYGDMNSYPEPFRSDMREMLRDYTLYTIHKDWNAHAQGKILSGGTNRVFAMRKRLVSFEPKTTSQEILHREVVQFFREFDTARRERIAGVFTQIPDVLWYALGAGALIKILLLIMLKIRPVQHLVLGSIVSFFLGVMLFVIISLDDPLRGENGIKPFVLQGLWDTRMSLDEPLA